MNRRKLIISVASLALVVVAVIAAVVGVLAASQQNVTSTLTVSYRANNVKAFVALDWKYQNDADWTGAGTHTFNATDATSTQTLGPVTANELGAKGTNEATFDRYVIFRFTITNGYSAGEGRAITSTLNYNAPAAGNYVDGWAQNNTDAPEVAFTGTTFSSGSAYGAAPTGAVTIAQGNTVYYYLVVAIANVEADASYAGGTVQFTLNTVNPSA